MDTTPPPERLQHRALISSVSDVERPLWSVMIPTYNCASYLAKTLESVLEQDLGEKLMQITVVDDCSNRDDPEAVVHKVGNGRVKFFRQTENQGHVRNFATCINQSRGELVHLLHGDDYVLHGFYPKMGKLFLANEDIGLATCRHVYVDDIGHWIGISRLRLQQSGLWNDALFRLATEGGLQTPSVVVRRSSYERVGGFDERLLCTEDYEMWVRIAGQFPIWYETECLAAYRFRAGSNSSVDGPSGENLRDMRRSIDIIANECGSLLPAGWQKLISKSTARYAIKSAGTYLGQNRYLAAIQVLYEASRFDTSLGTFARAIKYIARGLHDSVRARSPVAK